MPSFFDYPAGVGFLLNPFFGAGDLPIEIVPGVSLDRASTDDCAAIKGLLERLGSLADWGNLFRFEPIPKHVRESKDCDRKLPLRQTFWVLRFQGNSISVDDACSASRLCGSELELGAVFPLEGAGLLPLVIWHSNFFYYSEVQWEGNAQIIDRADLMRIHSLCLKLADFAAAPDDPIKTPITRLIERFFRLSDGQRYGDLALLGHFALIEGLITHEPKPSAGDSLSHQIATKMPLLMKKFSQPLTMSEHVDELDSTKAWKRLYDVRSRIAHGDEVDYRARHAPLRDARAVFTVVRESLKRLLVLALDEPEFVTDLRAC